MSEYLLITANDPDVLTERVMDYLQRGWSLYGSPFGWGNSMTDTFCQAVVRTAGFQEVHDLNEVVSTETGMDPWANCNLVC